MKRFSPWSAFVFLIILSLSISCKKEDSSQKSEPEPVGFYVKFKVEGVQKLFTYTEGMKFQTTFWGDKMYLEAREDIDRYPYIQLDFSNGKKIFNKNFTFSNKIASDTLGFITYGEGGNAQINDFRTLPGDDTKTGVKDFVFSLTEKTDVDVRGTFSGTVFGFNGGTVQTKKITEGKFYLSVKVVK